MGRSYYSFHHISGLWIETRTSKKAITFYPFEFQSPPGLGGRNGNGYITFYNDWPHVSELLPIFAVSGAYPWYSQLSSSPKQYSGIVYFNDLGYIFGFHKKESPWISEVNKTCIGKPFYFGAKMNSKFQLFVKINLANMITWSSPRPAG